MHISPRFVVKLRLQVEQYVVLTNEIVLLPYMRNVRPPLVNLVIHEICVANADLPRTYKEYLLHFFTFLVNECSCRLCLVAAVSGLVS